MTDVNPDVDVEAWWLKQWEWYQRKLAGLPVRLDVLNEPQAGFYRKAEREYYGARRTFVPVAYYPTGNGQLGCRIGDEEIHPSDKRFLETWIKVLDRPVTEEAFREVAQRNGRWPDEPELVDMQSPPMGHNRPPPDRSFEGLREEIETLYRDASIRITQGPIRTQEESDKVTNLGDRLAELSKMVEEERKAERKPHDDACIAIQKKWVPIRDKADIYKDVKRVLTTPWLQREDARKQEEAKAAEAAGDPAPQEARRSRSGTRGRAVTLRTRKSAEIVDYAACLEFFKDHDDIRKTVQHLANQAVRVGGTVPGIKVIEEQVAV